MTVNVWKIITALFGRTRRPEPERCSCGLRKGGNVVVNFTADTSALTGTLESVGLGLLDAARRIEQRSRV